ncbi:hypothetical protein P43SY_010011 [Pythium insidiosum]|uniref:Elicitor-like transglutaminase n=1 Tax=Pythium insidiosum TaxID=114742 RepID=A0AAD5LUE2_PYTIN|nr:hypothetical protein P43SY_010011 [Pythium insidiosum]
MRAARLAVVLALGAALQERLVAGLPLEFNPVTRGGDTLCLSRNHPAVGAELEDTSAAEAEIRELPESIVLAIEVAAAGGANASETSPRATDVGTVETPGFEATEPRQSRRLEATNADLQRLEQHFGASMDRNIRTLPGQGSVEPTPWPSSYWPMFQDGINFVWSNGEPSPSEKYAMAHGLDPKQFSDTVSRTTGIDSMGSRRSCQSDGDCSSLRDGSRCGRRAGASAGRCIPAWFGICHAWAPAAILEPEPRCPVTVNGVTFRAFDIKALITELYDGANLPTVFTGARFNGRDNEPNNRDQYGRFRDPTRRDIGPGFFHIAVANIMGHRQQSFIVDVSAGAEVWNQPVKSYAVVESNKMTPREAAWRYYRTSSYPFNPSARSLQFIKNRFTWVVESNEDGPLVTTGRAAQSLRSEDYSYLLELDGDDNIIGGEWVGSSHTSHPDFLWFPTTKPAATLVTSVGLSYQNVSNLLAQSLQAQC